MTGGERRRAPGFFGSEARSDSSDTRESLLQFLGPRYWRTWILVCWLRVWALLPWRWSLAIHTRLGRSLGRRSRKSMRIVRSNLESCFPELGDDERNELAAAYFGNMGAMAAELAICWFRSPEYVRKLVEARGVDNLHQALARGRGVILYLGHFTTMEICGAAVGAYAPRFVITYNKRRSRLLSELQRRSRERLGDELLPKNRVRTLLRLLRNNSVVWFAGDEVSTGKSAALLPFFGEPALTSTALPRLARITGAAVVPLRIMRKPDNDGYLIRFDPALDDFPGADDIEDTKRLVSILEDQIRDCPSQYFWKQQRFRKRRADRDEAQQD